MPARWMKQPNGKLARFSTIVDNFTHLDCTPEEAIEIEVEDFRESIRPKIDRGLAREVDSPDGWNDSLKWIKEVHGEKGLAELLEEFKDR